MPKLKAAKKSATKKPTRKQTAKQDKWLDAGDGSGIWTPLTSRSYGYGYAGSGQSSPSSVDLLTGFNDVVFSAIHLVSPNVAREANRYKLVVSTGPTDASPKSSTKALDRAERKRVEAAYPTYARRAIDIDEVVEHPVLDLLDRPNPHQSFYKLVELIDVYLELVGSAFVFINKLDIGTKSIPTAMWVLPSQYISIETDEDTGDITGYRYKQGNKEVLYRPDQILHFKFANPYDPYTGLGISPVRAVWQRIQLLDKEQQSWDSVLSNMTFPTVLVHPPENENYTPLQAQRIEKQLSEKGRLGGGQGGIWVITEGMQLESFATAPKDLSALQLYETIRKSICTAMNIPLGMLDLNDTNSETSDTVRRNFQRYCLSPRIDNILETFSHHLLPPRMWLVADSVVNPDKVYELQRVTALVSSDVITINEARVECGYEARAGLDKLHSEISALGTPSAQTFQTNAPTGRLKAAGKRYTSTHPDAKPLAEALRAVFGKLATDITAKLKAVPAARTKAFFPLETWTDELKKLLTPVLRVYFDDGVKAILAEVGGSTDIPRHAVQHLDDAVNRAVLHLAESTLNTTELSVDAAVEATREAIRAGLNHGEAHNQLRDRIGEIFTDLSERRTMLIAETEASRAKHSGELIGIEAAGVDAKKVWLPDAMACDFCKQLAAKGGIPLDKDFAVVGSGPYSRVSHPPAHPACRCTLQYDLGV